MRIAVALAAVAVLGANSAAAQERGWLAIGVDRAVHAFSFSSEADALNSCGYLDCEVVETFVACLAVAYSRETASGRPVWTWTEAATAGDARQGARDECTAAGGLACAVENTYCLDGSSAAALHPPADVRSDADEVVDFGDDAGEYARDGECDDPRFEGPGAVIALDSHRGHDATDCRQLFESGHISLRSADAALAQGTPALDFGDDTGEWARDGECDDPRFEGPGMGLTGSESDRGRDATDCRELFEAGRVSLIDVGVDFGDDASPWARDGECDDPRFEGPGMGLSDSEEDRGHDATDCRELLEAGRISLISVDTVTPSPNPASAGGQAHLLVWSAEPTDEHARIHIYIDGDWQVNRDVWYSWDGPPPDCNYRETLPEAVGLFANFYLEPGQYRIRAAAPRNGRFNYDDHGFGPDIVFAVEETLDLQPGCNVFEIVKP